MGQAGEDALAEVEVEKRNAGGRIVNFLAGYFPWQGPGASGRRFLFSNYKDAYERFENPPRDLPLVLPQSS